jgi:hypothetical protein
MFFWVLELRGVAKFVEKFLEANWSLAGVFIAVVFII